jgi:hypothetical protein
MDAQICEPGATLVPHLCPEIMPCCRKCAAIVRLYFCGIENSYMAALDLMEVTMSCYVKFGMDIAGIPSHGVWNIVKSAITDLAFDVTSSKYSMYRIFISNVSTKIKQNSNGTNGCVELENCTIGKQVLTSADSCFLCK